ncbi:2-dehydropantoate 2-reductase [Bacillus benzoevorans]|uniref:2-dehydropantoate 2-reductase n=1 Tax=Bacillus benzoevorans TaxID=1456 RepID=A0A7X0HN45_9BACI|nr:2-dehydropantoate 2-reductase [Bacillus benzoevorans]MBB6443733.1 2-dehydropantoate 2-reductase [Bacillus benzoevorans]
MKIGIIGGGSIGLLFACYLSRKQPVCLYVRTNEQKKLLQEKGLIFVRETEEQTNWIEVKLYSEWRGMEDATLIAVKQYQLDNMMGILNKYSNAGKSIVFLQNGMGHIKKLDCLAGNIYVAAVEHGAMRTNGNRVLHTGLGTTKIAPYRQSDPQFLHWLDSEYKDMFPFIMEENYENMLLKKLVANAVINPLTAVLRVKNGEIIENPHYFQMVLLLFSEIEQSLELEDGQAYFKNVRAVCMKTAENQSSMLRDLEEKRPTEVDAILGYILEKAGEREINTPVMKALFHAVKGKECNVEG